MGWETSDRRSRLPPDWQKRRSVVLKRDPVCKLQTHCNGARSTEVDHRDTGDDHRLANLQGVCATCHRAKTAREASGSIGYAPRPPEPHPGRIT